MVATAVSSTLAADPASAEEAVGPVNGRRLSPRQERRLVRAAQDGSADAIEGLFRAHWRQAHRAAFLVVQDSAAAEDIAQEAFLSAIRSLHRFDRGRRFGPWLHRIVVNRSIDLLRARTLRGEVRSRADAPGEAREAVAEAGQGGFSEQTLAAIAALPAEQRAAIVLRYLLEFTPGEIASTLGLPRGTVNSRLRRALDQLGRELGDER